MFATGLRMVAVTAHRSDEEFAAVGDFDGYVRVHGVLAEEFNRNLVPCFLIA